MTTTGTAAAAEPVTERISVSSTGVQANAASDSAAVSDDGRYVAFSSSASNLVPNDTNGRQDVFVRDRMTGQTSRVSVSSSGAQASDGIVIDVGISGSGRYVTFVSTATGLAPGDTLSSYDAFLHDRSLGTTTRIAATTEVEINRDGRYAVTYDGNGVYRHDLATGNVVLASIDPAGSSLQRGAQPTISPDGRYVAFVTSTPLQVYVRDMQAGETIRASNSSDGAPGNIGSMQPSVSDGGRFIAFSSDATNLVAGDTNGVRDTFVFDSVTGETTRVNVSSGGSQANNALSHEGLPSISADGRMVAFASTANNLVPGDTNLVPDVFVHDRSTRQTFRASVSSSGTPGNAFSAEPAISGDGSHVAFHSRASNLVSGDTNGVEDVFVRQLVTPDATPPDITYSVTPAEPDGANGWYVGHVLLDWTVAEAESTVALTGCEDRAISVDQPKLEFSCAATSAGGSAGPVTVTIGRDATSPDVHTTVTPAEPDGSNGWYVSPVSLAYDCSDAISGVATCPQGASLAEGASQQIAALARDNAGNVREVATAVDVDLTDPTVDCGTAPTFLLGENANLTAGVNDAVSGPAALTSTANVDTSAVGGRTVEVTGSDNAGRSGTASCRYQVQFGFSGWAAPVDSDAVNVMKAGSAVPLKWRLVDYSGTPVTDLASVGVSSVKHACDGDATEDTVEELTSGGSGLQNLGDGDYQLNWKSDKAYAGSCRTLRLDLGEGVPRTAEFRFTR